ncbi:flagella basal body P-ring formation protein FlgA [Crenobacter cavernae]|uniref:Flagella basal body P-ring formation protein FlgA n=2 Tax=Crenobacter cavernae TaxID=2290923 RepID=A0ABY0FEA3_9NEIS|nr:flagella basal body P-ring formation protein FlgA [Crenobacter cavernae]
MAGMKISRYLALAFLTVGAAHAAAAGGWASLEAPVRAFLDAELKPRGVTYKLVRPSGKLDLPACTAPAAGWPAGSAQSGNTYVEVHCPEAGWQVRFPVGIDESRMGLVTTRRIQAGEALSASDVRLASLPNPALGRQVLNVAEAAVGQVARSGLPEGAWVRRYMLAAPRAVHANQPVMVHALSDGLSVAAQGKALANAAVGDEVTVRMPSGRQVRGEVQKDGSVRLAF